MTGINNAIASPSKYSYIVKGRASNRSSVSESKSGRLTPEYVFDGLYGNPLKDGHEGILELTERFNTVE